MQDGACSGSRSTDGACDYCKLCAPCKSCFSAADPPAAGGGSAQGESESQSASGCRKDGSELESIASNLTSKCVRAFDARPTCEPECNTSLASAAGESQAGGSCWLQIQSAAAPGLVHTIQQVCRGPCEDDAPEMTVGFIEHCGDYLSGHGAASADSCASLQCRHFLQRLEAHACRVPVVARLGAAYEAATRACGGCESKDTILRGVRAHCSSNTTRYVVG